jgi:hypothetical protein
MTKSEIIAKIEYLQSDQGRSLGTASWTFEVGVLLLAIAKKLPEDD